MMRILALDTSTHLCSAALCDGEQVWSERVREPRRHTELLLPMVDRLFSAAGFAPPELDVVAFGRGPGSFTGLRIALGVAQGLAFACDKPMVGVSSLAAMAQIAAESGRGSRFACALDARMGEVYWARYVLGDDGLVQLHGSEQLLAPGQVEPPDAGQWLALGNGWQVQGMPVAAALDPDCEPDARMMLKLAEREWRAGAAVSAERAAPAYLRERVAQTRN